MNKADFVKAIAEKTEMSVKDVTAVLKAFDEEIAEVIANEDSVRLGIGTISGYTKETAARNGRNPLTGEALAIPARTYKGYPKMKFSKAVKPDAE